jgi:SAM-dependent methyltransferase
MPALFPPGDDLVRLVETLLGDGRPAALLDLGAGTGGLALRIAARGHPVTAVDASPELVAAGRQAAAAAGLAVRWVEGDLVAAPRTLGDRFAVVTCVGNTLPHLPDRAAVRAALAAFHDALAPGGAAVLLTIPVERCLARGELTFPERTVEVAGERFVLRRRYTPGAPGRLRFSTEIEVTGGDGPPERSGFELTHLALRAEELTAMAGEAGFADVKLLGGYGGAAWSPEAPATVVVASLR